MVDAKKLVVAFLIFAVVAGTLAFLATQPGVNGSATAPSASLPFTAAGISASSSAANAFTVQSPASEGAFASNAFAGAASSPDNLTNQLADAYANDVAAYNPDGPQTDASGTPLVAVPTEESVLEELASSSAYQDLKIPNWDVDPALQAIRISTDTDASATAAYGGAVSDIINQYFVATGLQNTVSDPSAATPGDNSFVASQINGALNDLGALAVPANLAAFQKSFVRVLVYDRNALDLAENSSVDPLKAAIIFQGESSKYNAAVQELQNAWQSALADQTFANALASSRGPAAHGGDAIMALLKNAFTIPTAHAFGFEIVYNPTQLSRTIWQWVQGLLLQILKNTLISLLQNKVLALIQNSGNPLLIQMWGPFINSAFNVAAGAALGQIFPTLCPNFSTNVGGWLKNSFSSANITPGGISLNGSPGTNCTLYNAVSNIPGYYNNFSVGGMNGFAALLSPNNNPYGAFMEAYDSVVKVASANQHAAEDNALASNGYKGQQKCGNGATTTSSTCANGTEPITLTPGTTIKSIFHSHTNSDTKLIVNANAIIGLALTIAGSVVQKAVLSGTAGIAGTQPPPVVTITPPALPPLMCTANPPVATTTDEVQFAATGGASDSYSWSVPAGVPSSGTGDIFTTVFYGSGTQQATVTNGTSTATCSVNVQP